MEDGINILIYTSQYRRQVKTTRNINYTQYAPKRLLLHLA